MSDNNKIFLLKRVRTEAYVQENQNCMNHLYDVDSYIKYLKGLNSIAKDPIISEVLSFVNSKQGRDNFPQVAKSMQSNRFLTESSNTGEINEVIGYIAKGLGWVARSLAAPFVAVKRSAGVVNAARRQAMVHSRSADKARQALKGMANTKKRFKIDPITGQRNKEFFHSAWRESQRKVAKQSLKQGKKDAIRAFEKLHPGQLTANTTRGKYAQLKNLTRSGSSRSADARAAISQGHQNALKYYKKNGPGTLRAFHNSMMTSAGAGAFTVGAGVTGFYGPLAFTGYLAHFMLDKCKDPSQGAGVSAFSWTSECCEDENFEEFIKTKNPKLLAKGCLDELMKHCGEIVMPFCGPGGGPKPEGWDPKNCRDCYKIMAGVSQFAPSGQFEDPEPGTSTNVPGMPGLTPAQMPGANTSNVKIPAAVTNVFGKPVRSGCIAPNDIYASAEEVAEDLMCVYNKSGEGISKGDVSKAICNTNFIQKLQKDINRLLGEQIPVTGKIDKATAPLIKKLVQRVRPHCVGMDYLGQKK